MDRNNIDEIAKTPEDRVILAKLWDKISSGIRKNIPVSTGFLSPRELDMARYLFGNQEGLIPFGGCDQAQRKMLCYLPDYLDESYLTGEDAPMVCLRAKFYENDALTHRDFLGALMGAGITRDCVGDIYAGKGQCDFFVTTQIAPYLLQNFTDAGRTRLQLSAIALADAVIPEPETVEIRDTLASVRLDSVISAGFRISRSLAVQHIAAGKAAIDGLPTEKPEKAVAQGAVISLRGYGKLCLSQIGNVTKKGRISVLIHRYK